MNVDCYGIMTCAGVGKPWKLFPETFTTGKEASAFYVDHLSSEGNLFRIIEINIVSQKCAGVGKPWKLFPETFTTGKEASAFYVDHLSSEGNLFRIIEINIVSQNMLYH